LNFAWSKFQHLSPKMTAVSSKDFVWAKDGLRKIDQVINVDIAQLSSGPVSCILYIVFEPLAACGL